MSKRQCLCILGILVIIIPFLGFTDLWDRIISVAVGLSTVVISYNLPHEKVENISENI